MTGDRQDAGHGKKKPQGRLDSAAAELAAYAICKTPLELNGRKAHKGFAIDCANPNDPMDRDDAVQVEYRDDPVLGRLTILHVTIADVASVLPRASEREVDRRLGALDEEARGKGQTKYFSHGSRPMFPRRLQDRMSLENNRERAGLTLSITYDQHCNRLHTELSRTRITTTCKSYVQASSAIAYKGDTSNQLQKIALLAAHLTRAQGGSAYLPHYDQKSGMYTDTDGMTRHISSEASSSYVAVQACMIAANEAAAELMRQSNFMFRNHGGRVSDEPDAPVFYSKAEQSRNGHQGRLLLGASEYAEDCKGHFGLGSAGYSHITSPIRRYADVVNQRMLHWSVDVVEAVAQAAMAEAARNRKGCTRERLSWLVWDQAQELMAHATGFKEMGRNRKKIEAGKRLEDSIYGILLPVLGNIGARGAAQAALRGIDAMELPYTRKEVAALAKLLNEKLRKRASGFTPDEMMNATLDAIFIHNSGPDEDGYVHNPEHKEEAIRRRRPYKFAELLEAAARRGDNNDFFASEVSRRLHGEDDKVELVRNLYTLLVVADKEKDVRWQQLKREAFQMLKDDPVLAERVFNYLQAQHKPPKVFILETSLLDKDNVAAPAALVVLHHEGVDYSAPMLDTGESAETARAHAILTFFRHYGALSPHEELYTPKLIDLALGRARVRKGERLAFLKKLCGADFTLEEQAAVSEHDPERIDVTLRLKRGQDEVMEKTRQGWAAFKDEYMDKCAKDMIEDYRFVDLLSQLDTTPEEPARGQKLFSERYAHQGIDRRNGRH